MLLLIFPVFPDSEDSSVLLFSSAKFLLLFLIFSIMFDSMCKYPGLSIYAEAWLRDWGQRLPNEKVSAGFVELRSMCPNWVSSSSYLKATFQFSGSW